MPPALAPTCSLGALVRVPLGGRRVRGWVVGEPAAAPPGVSLRPVAAVLAAGPSAEVLALARAGAHRYAGRLRPFLLAASAHRLRDAAPAPAGRRACLAPGDDALAALVRRAWAGGTAVLRLAPATARLPVVTECVAACGARDLLVLVPERRDVELLAGRLARLGVDVARYPGEWGRAAAGGRVVVGPRTAVLATMPALGGILVLDAEAESYVDERAPTYSAVELAVMRARAAGVPFLATSAAPTLALVAAHPVHALAPVNERAQWPAVEVIDRREEDPRSGRYSPRLAPAIRAAAAREPRRPVVCVLNRIGRARRLACASCGELARCAACGAALVEATSGGARVLSCPACASERPVVCAACGAAAMKVLRVGAQRAAEELAALCGLEVATVAGPDGGEVPAAPVLVGTEAVLHRVGRAALVVFLDIDLDLVAPRLRAGEHTLALLARAGRLVGARPAGRVIVQTRCPDHEVLRAAQAGDPTLFSAPELARRRALGLPPSSAVASVTGPDVASLAGPLRAAGLEAVLPEPERLLVRAGDATTLADGLAAAASLERDVRVAVDPLDW